MLGVFWWLAVVVCGGQMVCEADAAGVQESTAGEGALISRIEVSAHFPPEDGSTMPARLACCFLLGAACCPTAGWV